MAPIVNPSLGERERLTNINKIRPSDEGITKVRAHTWGH